MLGWRRRPLSSVMTTTFPSFTVATTELVVPRSMPMTGSANPGSPRLHDARRQIFDRPAAFPADDQGAHAGAAGRSARLATRLPLIGLRNFAGQDGSVAIARHHHEVARAQMGREAQAARSIEHQLAQPPDQRLRGHEPRVLPRALVAGELEICNRERLPAADES